MDYEKKYNEALERAKELIAQWTGKNKDVYTEDYSYIFPELRESEDERIRKEIIDYLGLVGKGDGDYAQPMIDRWIAYLEKQKYDRMKPVYDARESFKSALEKAWNDYHNGYENVDKLEDDYVECAHAKGFREGYLFGIEKKKEQKPPITGNDFGWIDELKHDLEHPEELDQKVDDVLKQRKGIRALEWSEEDEEMLNRIINDYENGDKYWFKAQCSTPFRPKIAWLKSLQKRFSYQTK